MVLEVQDRVGNALPGSTKRAGLRGRMELDQE